jgi:hypothetical protein
MIFKLRSHGAPFPSFNAVAWSLAVLLLGAAIGSGQIDSGRAGSGGEGKRYSVQGTVVNSVTGIPIARALVNLGVQGERMGMTDANGVFHIEGVPEGQARLTAERPGFFPSDPAGRLVPITSDVDGLVIALSPQAVISGRITSIQNVPIEELPVHLYRRVYVNGRAQWQMANTVTSDDDGQFRIGGLQAGSYCLSAGPENWKQRASGSRPRGYAQVFYPNAADLASASVISLSAGQQVEADLSLTQEPLFEISGQVVGVPPGLDAGVELRNSTGDPLPIQQMHSERHDFSTYVPAGRYVVKAFVINETLALQGTVPVNVAANVAGIQVPLGSRSAIPVNVRMESGGGNSAQLSPNVSVMLMPTANSSNISQAWAQPVGGRRGSLEINGAEPGTYSVEITTYGKYVVSATSGTTDLLRDDLTVSADGGAAPIEIVLGSDGGEVSGNVKLSDRANGVTVLLVPEHGAAGQVKSAATGASGEFQFEQVRPGDYYLLALEHGDDLEYQNPDVLSGYLSSATRVSVAPKQQAQATLELIAAGK